MLCQVNCRYSVELIYAPLNTYFPQIQERLFSQLSSFHLQREFCHLIVPQCSFTLFGSLTCQSLKTSFVLTYLTPKPNHLLRRYYSLQSRSLHHFYLKKRLQTRKQRNDCDYHKRNLYKVIFNSKISQIFNRVQNNLRYTQAIAITRIEYLNFDPSKFVVMGYGCIGELYI